MTPYQTPQREHGPAAAGSPSTPPVGRVAELGSFDVLSATIHLNLKKGFADD
jgi:hypothetical protein